MRRLRALWVDLPPALMRVLAKGLEIGRASNGAFDIGLGDLTNAWGFGPPRRADDGAIRAYLGQSRPPAHDLLELDAATVPRPQAGELCNWTCRASPKAMAWIG